MMHGKKNVKFKLWLFDETKLLGKWSHNGTKTIFYIHGLTTELLKTDFDKILR